MGGNNIIPLQPFLNSMALQDEYSIYPLVKMDKIVRKSRELATQCSCRNRLNENKQNMKYVWFHIGLLTELV